MAEQSLLTEGLAHTYEIRNPKGYVADVVDTIDNLTYQQCKDKVHLWIGLHV